MGMGLSVGTNLLGSVLDDGKKCVSGIERLMRSGEWRAWIFFFFFLYRSVGVLRRFLLLGGTGSKELNFLQKLGYVFVLLQHEYCLFPFLQSLFRFIPA